jgi:hypothetical protein
MEKEEKKVVDLIYIDKQKDAAALIKEYNFSLDYWKDSLKEMQENCFEQHYNSTASDVMEILNMRKFLGKFLQTRLNWIVSDIDDSNLQGTYLNVLPPFPQKGGIKRILLHFFQMESTQNQRNIVYRAKNDIEKEISILWDIYKLRKTIDSIETIKKALNNDKPFASTYSVEKRLTCLDSLKTVFQLMFQMTIRKEHQKTLYNGLTADLMQPENVLERQSRDDSFVYSHVISKFDYRNHFFYVYFSSGMKAKVGGKIKAFKFNYLDFELIKQEFLIDWMKSKLKGNHRKNEIYSRYSIGNMTIDKIIENDPSKEIQVLKQLPLAVFNDITAEVNEAVASELKTGVESFSENHGEFAKISEEFDKAQEVAKSPISKIKNLLKSKKANVKSVPEEPDSIPEPPKEIKPEYTVINVKKNHISYPYFQKEAVAYKSKLSLLRVKMGTKYPEFNRDLSKFFTNVTESALIIRRTPKHEVIYPNIIKEQIGDEIKHHLLILGAEVKAKQLGMGYSSSSSESTHAYTCFFLYGSEQPNALFGEIQEQRHARGIDFNMYSFANAEVQKLALQFFDLILKK